MPGERTEIVSWLQTWSHHVPTETQPREWRRTQIGQMGDGGVCFCVMGLGSHHENEAAANKEKGAKRYEMLRRKKSCHNDITVIFL